MKLSVYTQLGEKKADMSVPAVFETKVSAKTLALYYNYIRAAIRFPNADTLGRGEVSGGGKKPWKQKGTGNARVGSTRSPLWVHGGVTFGPTSERNFTLRMSKRDRNKAIFGLISNLVADGKVAIIDKIEMAEAKTKLANEVLENLKAEGKIAIIESIENEKAWLSFRNIAGTKLMSPGHIDFIYLMAADNVIITKDALDKMTKAETDKK